MRYYATTIARDQIHTRWVVSSLTILLTLALAVSQAFGGMLPTPKAGDGDTHTAARYGKLPLHFIPNKGQADAAVKYMARGNGYAIFLTADEAVLALKGAGDAVVRMQIQGANADAAIEAREELEGKVNYLSGKPSEWISNLSTFAAVHYKEVYPGIDVVYYGADGMRLEYDFVVAPGVNPDVIRFTLEGAEAMTLDADGNLVLSVSGREVTQLAPFTYQVIDGVRQEVESRYVLEGDQIAFAIGAYDESLELVIDPVMEYSTFLGGTGDDDARAIAVDASGNAYVAGCTDSGPANFPAVVPNSPSSSTGDVDAFVTKLNASGTAVIWSTFIAGTKEDCAEGIALNSSNEPIIAGYTESTTGNGFPLTNNGGLAATHSGGTFDAFVAKLAADGSSIVWSGFLGGTGIDKAYAIAINSTDRVYVTGETADAATDMQMAATTFDATHNGVVDAFLAKINDSVFPPTYVYSGFLGGNGTEIGYGIAADGANAYLTGSTTSSTTFPLVSAFDATYNGAGDAFFTRINTSVSGSAAIEVSTYIGGTGADTGYAIALGTSNEAHVVGTTASINFSGITAGTLHDTYLGGATDGFVSKFSTAGTVLLYGTYLGGAGVDAAHGVAVDHVDRAHVVGSASANLAFYTANAIQSGNAGSEDAFYYRLETDGASAIFADDFGGSANNDHAHAVAVDSDESAYVAGRTLSNNFPVGTFETGSGFGSGHTPPAYDESYNGNIDAFVVKFGASADLAIDKSVENGFFSPLVSQQIVYNLKVTNNGADQLSRFIVTDDLPAGLVFISDVNGVCTGPSTSLPASGVRGPVTCDVMELLASGESFTIKIKVEVRAMTPITNCASVVNNSNDPDLANNTDCVTITPQPQVNFWLPANQDAATATAFVSIPQGVNSFGTTFVGTDGGGVYRTTDQGENWYPTNLIDVNVRGLARSSANGALWAVTYGDGAFRSQSGLGGHFDPVNFLSVGSLSPQNLLSIAINNFNPANNAGDHDVFIGTDGSGVHYSDDDASSFQNITYNLPNLVVRSLAISQVGAGGSDDRVFAGTHGRGVWFLDYNGGPGLTNTWIDANGDVTASAPQNASLDRAVVHALAVDGIGISGAVLYAGTNNGVYRGEWNGTKYLWEHVLSTGAASWEGAPVVRSLLVYHCDGEDYLMAGTDGQYVYRIEISDLDSGSPYGWQRFTGLMSSNNTMSGLQSATVLALHFTDWDEYLYAGTQDEGVHLSTDCGETFEQITNTSLQDAYRVIQALQFNPNGNKLYGGTFGFGVIMSDDLSDPQAPPILNWTSTNHGLSNKWIYSMALRDVSGTDYLFAGTWNGGVFRSTDGAETWQFSGLANRIVYDLDHNQNGVLYAATNLGEVARSMDNGLTWQETGVATTAIWALGIDKLGSLDPNMSIGDIYAGTFGAGIYKSIDGGFTWTQTNQKTGHIFDFAFGLHPETGDYAVFAATSTGVIYSTDGGLTWSTFQNNVGLTTPDSRAIAFALGGDELLVGTWGGGVFRYDADSDAWIRDGLPGHAISLFAVHPTTGEVFTTSGQGVFRKKFTSSSTVGNDEWTRDEQPEAYSLLQNYPNPFNPATMIEFAMPEAGDVRLSVFDALGRQIRVLVDGRLTAGTHQVTFEAGNLPSGVYFYRLETPRKALTQTMILMK